MPNNAVIHDVEYDGKQYSIIYYGGEIAQIRLHGLKTTKRFIFWNAGEERSAHVDAILAQAPKTKREV